MSTELLRGMTIFVRVAETKSFTHASARLGLSPSAVSKAIGRLEGRLGVRLLYRNTRRVSLTDDGVALLERSRQILGELEDLESTLTGRRAKPRGRLRLQMPAAFGRRVVMPLLTEFVEQNDELSMDVELSDRVPDLADEGLDAAIRSGTLKDSSLVARKLCDIKYVSVASPSYIKRCGEPRTPSELEGHRCLGFYTPHTHRYREWHFASGDGLFSKPVHGHLNVNSAEALMDAAIAGAGIARLATFIAAEPIRLGLLRPVLRTCITAGPTLWLVYPQRQFLPVRVQALMDFLTARIPRAPVWDVVS
jgi:LysR family transcriptional regulator for bpeEF and oprC